jgi:MFS family permease
LHHLSSADLVLISNPSSKTIYTVNLVAGPIIGGIAGGYIAFEVGWAYVFWVGTALTAAVFVGTILFVPETLYFRDAAEATRDDDPYNAAKEMVTQVERTATHRSTYEPYTWTRSLGFIKPPGSWLHYFVQPWRTLALPGTWVVMLHYGGLVGGIVTISTIGPQLVAEPPYLWGNNTGLINIGALVGCILGAVYTYLLSDARLKSQAKHESHGFAEPESRLPTMFPALIIATGGFLTFGFCAQNPSPKAWVGLEFGYGMISFGLMQVPSIGFNYVSGPPQCVKMLPSSMSLNFNTSSSIPIPTWRPTVSLWSPSCVPSSRLPGHFSCPTGLRWTAPQRPLEYSVC